MDRRGLDSWMTHCCGLSGRGLRSSGQACSVWLVSDCRLAYLNDSAVLPQPAGRTAQSCGPTWTTTTLKVPNTRGEGNNVNNSSNTGTQIIGRGTVVMLKRQHSGTAMDNALNWAEMTTTTTTSSQILSYHSHPTLSSLAQDHCPILPDCLHGFLPAPFLLSYSAFDFIFSLFFSFWAVR